MHIRHVIKDGNMCQKTGQLITKNANDSEKEDRERKTCIFAEKECKFNPTDKCAK